MEAQDSNAVQECPECKQQSLLFNPYYKLYECKNEACKLTFSEKDMTRRQNIKATAEPISTQQQKRPARAVVGTQYFDAETGRWKQMKLKSKRLSSGDVVALSGILGAIVLGLAGAILGGTIWYFVAILTGWQIGLLAIGVGVLVGYGVLYGAGQKRARKLQLISMALTVIALLIGEYLIMQYYYTEAGWEGFLSLGLFFRTYGENLISDYWGILDIFFFALAMWYAYRVPSPRIRR